MSKKKKTRQQKIVSDQRRTQYFLSTPQQTQGNQFILYDTSYVFHDLLKTFILSILIIGTEIILFYALKNNIITIPFISYR